MKTFISSLVRSIARRPAARKGNPSKSRDLRVESLESRELLSVATVTELPVPSKTVQAGASAVVSQFQVKATSACAASGVVLMPGGGAWDLGLDQVMGESGWMRVDWDRDGNKGNGYEYTLGQGRVNEIGTVPIDYDKTQLLQRGQIMNCQATIYTDAAAPSGSLKVTVGALEVNSLRNVSYDDSQISYTGSSSYISVQHVTPNLFVTQEEMAIPQYLVAGEETTSLQTVVLRNDGATDIQISRLPITDLGGGKSLDQVIVRQDWSDPIAVATAANAGSTPVPAVGTTYVALFNENPLVIPAYGQTQLEFSARVKDQYVGGVSGDKVQLSVQPGFIAAHDVQGYDLVTGNPDRVGKGEIFVGATRPGPSKAVVGTQHEVTYSAVGWAWNADPNPDGSPIQDGVSTLSSVTFVGAHNENTKDGPNVAQSETLVYHGTAVNTSVLTEGFSLSNDQEPWVTSENYVVTTMDGTIITKPTVTGEFLVKFNSLSLSAVNTAVGSDEQVTLNLAGQVKQAQVDPSRSALLQLELWGGSSEWYDRDDGMSIRRRGLRFGRGDVVIGTMYQS